MLKKTVTQLILLVLIAIALFYLVYRQGLKDKQKQIVPPVMTKEAPAEIKDMPYKEIKAFMPAPQINEAKIGKKELWPGRTFWGNLGYLFKDGKSTFIPYAIQEQMRRDYEEEIIQAKKGC